MGRVLVKDKPGMVTLSPTEFDDDPNTQVLHARRESERRTLPTLRVVAGPDMLRFCSIYPNETITIGRDESCELPLTDVSVSRHHASVTSIGSLLMLEDLGSTNGTNYGGEPLVTARQIKVGDEIEIGSVMLRVERLGMDELTHLARVVERLHLASKDSLTGLLSRRHLDNELPEQVRRYHRARIPLAAVFLDVDHFKKVNDTFGHGVGDDVLRALSAILTAAIRTTDFAIRYGGEEFVLVLPNSDEQGGAIFAERVRGLVERHDWSVYFPAGADRTVTISLGVAEYGGESVGAWMNRADKAMYRAKSLGRNRTCRASQA